MRKSKYKTVERTHGLYMKNANFLQYPIHVRSH